MNETDLRVVKTRESIERAFLSLLATKPLGKISVVELAREARINKGTFYLHYTDIMDLYRKTIRRQIDASLESADYFEDFFDDPQRFCKELSASFSSNLAIINTLSRDDSFSLIQVQTLDCIRKKLYETGRIKPCVQSDMRLDALLIALLFCRRKYEAEHSQEVDELMLSMIANFQAK